MNLLSFTVCLGLLATAVVSHNWDCEHLIEVRGAGNVFAAPFYRNVGSEYAQNPPGTHEVHFRFEASDDSDAENDFTVHDWTGLQQLKSQPGLLTFPIIAG